MLHSACACRVTAAMLGCCLPLATSPAWPACIHVAPPPLSPPSTPPLVLLPLPSHPQAIWVQRGGELDLHGKLFTPTWTRLAQVGCLTCAMRSMAWILKSSCYLHMSTAVQRCSPVMEHS